MLWRAVWRAAGAFALAAAVCLPSSAQPSPTESLIVEDTRPVAAAVLELMKRYRRIITYEDPRYLYAGHLKVIPAQIRNPAGQWVKTASILDAYITIPEQLLTEEEIIGAICAAVSEANAPPLLRRPPPGKGPMPVCSPVVNCRR